MASSAPIHCTRGGEWLQGLRCPRAGGARGAGGERRAGAGLDVERCERGGVVAPRAEAGAARLRQPAVYLRPKLRRGAWRNGNPCVPAAEGGAAVGMPRGRGRGGAERRRANVWG